jgi:hypothetical protein
MRTIQSLVRLLETSHIFFGERFRFPSHDEKHSIVTYDSGSSQEIYDLMLENNDTGDRTELVSRSNNWGQPIRQVFWNHSDKKIYYDGPQLKASIWQYDLENR